MLTSGVLLAACSSPPSPAAGGTPSARPAAAATTPSATQPAGTVPHIMVLVMENEGYGQIIGSSAAPYTNSLASSYPRAVDMYARAHYSLPNYLEMISGHDYAASGTKNDCSPSGCGPISGTSLGDQLDAAGISWRAFMGAMPSACDTSDAGGPGGYGVRHNPFVYFRQGRTSPQCQHDVPSNGLAAALRSPAPPDFVFYSPSICHDGGYDAPCSTIAAGDHFLKQAIPAIMSTPWYRNGGVIILTWDEGASSDTSGQYGDSGGHVLTVVISAKTKGASAYRGYVDTAGILRTVEHAYGLSYLGDAARPSSGTLPLG